jgi:hypothetical protein
MPDSSNGVDDQTRIIYAYNKLVSDTLQGIHETELSVKSNDKTEKIAERYERD